MKGLFYLTAGMNTQLSRNTQANGRHHLPSLSPTWWIIIRSTP